MNVELKPRTEPFPSVATANDNAEPRLLSLPARRRVRIYKPAKSAMTSGWAGTRRWLLEFEPQAALFIDPLMGWSGSADPMTQLRLAFPTREAAVAYAQRQNYDYEVCGLTKTMNAGAQHHSQRMGLWPIEGLPDQNTLLLFEIGPTDFMPDMAA